MFALADTAAKITSYNARAELHGEDPKPACDVGIEFAASNEILDVFAPGLKDALYREAQVDLVSNQKLRFEKLGSLSYGLEIVGAAFRLSWGATGKNDVTLDGVNVNKFRLQCEEGGTVLVSFRVQGHPTEKAAGRLSLLVGQDVTVTVTPPAEKEIADLADQVRQMEEEGTARAPLH